jgi:prepilin-type N-terminal cleavage/methylation domain-containing protein/prepilin-type processing-associated H-X9-DG protein
MLGLCVDTTDAAGILPVCDCTSGNWLSVHASSSVSRARGFTLVELLVTIAIIALIVALLLIAIPQIQRQARSSVCLLESASVEPGLRPLLQRQRWPLHGRRYRSHRVDWVQGQGNLNGNGYETDNALKKGRMWSYISENPAVLQEPVRSVLVVPASRAPDSFNAFISTGEGPMWGGPPNWQVNTMGKIPLPSETLVTALKYDHRDTTSMASVSVTGDSIWIDKIAAWHPGHFNVSFADGSVLSYRHAARQDIIDYYMTLPQNGIYWPGPDFELGAPEDGAGNVPVMHVGSARALGDSMQQLKKRAALIAVVGGALTGVGCEEKRNLPQGFLAEAAKEGPSNAAASGAGASNAAAAPMGPNGAGGFRGAAGAPDMPAAAVAGPSSETPEIDDAAATEMVETLAAELKLASAC